MQACDFSRYSRKSKIGIGKFFVERNGDTMILSDRAVLPLTGSTFEPGNAEKVIKEIEAKKNDTKSTTSSFQTSNTGKGINSDSFKLGVLFVLSELEKGRKKSQILKDKRIAKLELGELNLSEEDVQKISQRFGIA